MLCKEVMRRLVTHVLPDAPVAQAARLMQEIGVGFLPVCTLDGQIVGVITDRDIALRLHGEARSAAEVAVSSVMTPKVIACHPNDSLESAMQLLGHHQIFRLVVREESGRLAGVLSLTDVAQCATPFDLARVVREVFDREYRFESYRSVPPPSVSARSG